MSSTSRTMPVLAGIVTGVVGFTSSFAVVLSGLQRAGANPVQAASGLLVICLTMGLGCVLFSWRLRMPITMAWSTPGAALLAAGSTPEGGFRTAVGAFLVTGILLALTGLIPRLSALVSAIPLPLAQAMLAGVLLELCVEPITSLARHPGQIAPVLLTWLVLLRVARRWAVPGALAAALVVMAASGTFGKLAGNTLRPQLVLVDPAWHPGAVLALALPLYLVTMTSQNVPGMAVLAQYGYRPPFGPPLIYTGLTTAAGAIGGGHAINLAAISAALAAGPEAGPDQRRRWIAGVSAGVCYLVLGPLAALVTAISQAAPAGIMAAVAGVALIGTFASATSGALADPGHRDAAALTFLVAASGITAWGVGAAFWALLAGGAYLVLMRTRHHPATPRP